MTAMVQQKKKATIRYFGDYLLMGEIAEGGMGVVFDARQISLNRRVALKLIRSGARASEGELRRFRVEAEAAARLDHPGIVPIYEVGEHDGQAFLAMKLIEGESLAEKLEARGRSAEAAKTPKAGGGTVAIPSPGRVLDLGRDAARLIAQVARAVAHAHERGVFHRDIKPGNLLSDAAGAPHLTDFGIAKLVENDAHQTISHAMLGTPAYMSPEQAAGQREAISAASDIYSLGAVLHTLLLHSNHGSGTHVATRSGDFHFKAGSEELLLVDPELQTRQQQLLLMVIRGLHARFRCSLQKVHRPPIDHFLADVVEVKESFVAC